MDVKPILQLEEQKLLSGIIQVHSTADLHGYEKGLFCCIAHVAHLQLHLYAKSVSMLKRQYLLGIQGTGVASPVG